MRAAVRTWNASGMRIRFKAAARSRAQVRIATGGRRGCFGFAQIGYAPGRRTRVQLGAGCPYVSSMTGIVAHELGHILGLMHEDRRCAAMNTVLDARCGLQPAFEYRCRLLERDDVRGAVTRYGGRVRPVRADPYCPSFAAPQAPAIRTIAATGGSVDAGVAIAEPHRLVADAGPVIFAELLVYRYADACPPGAGAGAPYRRSYADYGTQTMRLDVTPEPGTWCYAVAVGDSSGRRSAFATAAVVVPEPAPEQLPLAPEPLPLPVAVLDGERGAGVRDLHRWRRGRSPRALGPIGLVGGQLRREEPGPSRAGGLASYRPIGLVRRNPPAKTPADPGADSERPTARPAVPSSMQFANASASIHAGASRWAELPKH